MKWLLLIELCSPLTARCEWRIADSYRTEEACVLCAHDPQHQFQVPRAPHRERAAAAAAAATIAIDTISCHAIMSN